MQSYTDEALLSMLGDAESDRVERKARFSGDVPKKVREAVCAFANDVPNYGKAGVVFIGAQDDGTPSGIEITEELLISLADMKTDGAILPLPMLTVEKRRLAGADMAVITVMPSDSPPVKYDGRIWTRTGPRRSLATEQEERVLNERRLYTLQPYDLRPFYDAKLSDLSRGFFEDEYLPAAFAKDVLDVNNRTYEERLASCKMIVSVENPVPTLLGLLAVGKQPNRFIYGSYVQFLRIDGITPADPIIDEKAVKGRLMELMQTSLEKLDVHNRRTYDITQVPGKVVTVDYPETALRQILCNALLHRSYEVHAPVRAYMYQDRIEIISSGGPYRGVTAENFGRPGTTAYRNPNLAEVMRNLDLIQHFGVGIYWARKAMAENGNPPIEFDVDTGFVRCILRKREDKNSKTDTLLDRTGYTKSENYVQ